MNGRQLPRLNLAEGWVLRLALLIGQSISLGITLSLLIILANSLFLADFGASALPYVYITVAITGAVLFYGLAALQRRWSLVRLAMVSVALLSAFYFLSWLGVTTAQMRWLSFPLVVSFSLVIQVGFVFLGGQAGRLLDVRQIKRLFPQIVAGFVIGFILGALIAPLLIGSFGNTENALIGIGFSSLAWLAFLYLTNQRYGNQLNQVDRGSRARPAQSLRQVIGKRYVLLIFLYLMLATMISQFSDFLVMAQAGTRYSSAEGLAQFFSGLTAMLNGADLLFTTLIAGLLISRLGLKTGLLANPVIMALFFLAMAITGPLGGLTSSLFFGLVVAARVANITLTDGMTRTSTNAAYQALPGHERVLVQTAAEGIGAPVALGIVGVLLLLYNAIPGLSLIHIVLFTLVLSAGWVVTSAAVYQSYKNSIVDILRRQALSEGDLIIEDPGTQAALLKLLQSGKPHEARLALDVLERASHPSLDERLVELSDHANPVIRSEAMARIEQRRVRAALPAVEARLAAESDLSVKVGAIRALCALQDGDADERVIHLLDDPEPALKTAALVGLLRYGGIPGAIAAGGRLASLVGSPDQEQRLYLARIIGEVQARSLYRMLMPLLQDADLEVRRAALWAGEQITHPALLETISAQLDDPQFRSAAASAFTAYGPAALPVVHKALLASRSGHAGQAVRLVRIFGQVGGEDVIASLKLQLDHPNQEVRMEVLSALSRCYYHAQPNDLPAIQKALEVEVAHAYRIASMRQDLGEDASLAPLLRALESELGDVRKRLFLLLSFQYERSTILRAEAYLRSTNEAEQALAVEALDVSMPAAQKALVMPLVDPQATLTQRKPKPGASLNGGGKSRDEHLQDIIMNVNGEWQGSWLRANAIYTAGSLVAAACWEAIEHARYTQEEIIRETAEWALMKMDLTGTAPSA